MTNLGISGQHDLLHGVGDKGRRGKSYNRIFQADYGFTVGDTGCSSQHHRCVILLGQLQRDTREFLAFMGVRRLKHGNLGKFGIVTVVLLVLGGMHLRVIGGHQNQTAPDACVGKGKQGVSGDIDTHMLHGNQCSSAGKGRPHGDLQSHFFIWRPGSVDILEAGHVFQDFRGRRTRICRSHPDACFIGAAGNGFVSGKDFFHVESAS